MPTLNELIASKGANSFRAAANSIAPDCERVLNQASSLALQRVSTDLARVSCFDCASLIAAGEPLRCPELTSCLAGGLCCWDDRLLCEGDVD